MWPSKTCSLTWRSLGSTAEIELSAGRLGDLMHFKVIRRPRILRTGIVLTPVVLLAIGFITYESSEFEEFPAGCYETDKNSTDGFTAIDGYMPCLVLANSPRAAQQFVEHKGATLFNSEGLGKAEFDQVVSQFKKHQNEDVWEYYVDVLPTWSYVIGASLLGLGALWICLAALDWVLAA